MRDKKEFFNMLSAIDGEPFEEYIKLAGDFDFSRYVLKIDAAEPEPEQRALIVVRVPQIIAAFPPHLFGSPVRRTALEDYLVRSIVGEIEELARYDEQGISRRRLGVAVPGQKILPRTALLVTEEYIEARVEIILPAQAGLVNGEAAKDLFFDELPSVVNGALLYANLDTDEVEQFVDVMEDADQIRQVLPTRGFLGFVARDAMPARLGSTDVPDLDQPRTFELPDELVESIETPNQGQVEGLAIPQGVTLILGDAYSGRVELMHALAHGIYNHLPGDGREMCVTVPDAVYVSAEPGRSVQRVDISAFIPQRADGVPTAPYSSFDADSLASQAAATVEALEMGARVLLFDESDSAAAFLSRDARLNEVRPGAGEGVIPLSSRVRQIMDELGVSVVVAGDACVTELIPVADTILRVDDYEVTNITREAKALEIAPPAMPADASAVTALVEKQRWILSSSIDPSAGRDDLHLVTLADDLLEFGRSNIDLHYVYQVGDRHQTETIGRILYYAKLHFLDEARPMREILELVDRDLSTEGLECLSRDLRGDLARPRRYEIAAALNRLDTLRISSTGG